MKHAYFILILLLPALSYSQSESKQVQVMMQMAMLRSSLLNKDSVGLESVLANDVTYGHSNGLIQTKPQLIRSVMSGDQDYKSIDASNMVVRVYDNTAVVTINLKVNLIFGGKPTDLNMYAMLVWVKKDKNWQLVARQSVKI